MSFHWRIMHLTVRAWLVPWLSVGEQVSERDELVPTLAEVTRREFRAEGWGSYFAWFLSIRCVWPNPSLEPTGIALAVVGQIRVRLNAPHTSFDDFARCLWLSFCSLGGTSSQASTVTFHHGKFAIYRSDVVGSSRSAGSRVL